MKQWVHKLLEQFDYDWGMGRGKKPEELDLSEEKATLLYIIDTYNKHLLEIEKHPVRKVRETLDEFAKSLIQPDAKSSEKLLFRFRQWFSNYRIDEYTYTHKTFEDFKGIIWDFIEQLSDDFEQEEIADQEIQASLNDLKEAVEANSIDVLRTKSREFVDTYIEFQSRRDSLRSKRLVAMKKNLDTVKQKLVEANHTMRRDHLTGAYNRMSFDERIKEHVRLFELNASPVTLLALDIDHFKKVNDTYGHDIGDFVLKECVRILQETFPRDNDFVARVGGEEFSVILPDYQIEHAIKKVEALIAKIRKDVFIIQDKTVRFTISVGIAQIDQHENPEHWIKRADEALYQSKNTGRDKYTIAAPYFKKDRVA